MSNKETSVQSAGLPCRRLLPLFLLPLFLGGCGEPEDTGPGRPVAHRRAAFLAILKASEPMGIDLRTGNYSPDRFVAMADSLARVKDGPWSYFVPGSNYPPTHATSNVWDDPAEFERQRQRFVETVDGLVAATATRDESRVAAAYAAMQDTCRSCHKQFKR